MYTNIILSIAPRRGYKHHLSAVSMYCYSAATRPLKANETMKQWNNERGWVVGYVQYSNYSTVQ